MTRSRGFELALLGLLCLGTSVAAAAPRSGGGEGWLHVKKYIPDAQRGEFKGYSAPKIFVYADADGRSLPSARPGGYYEPGDYAALPEGWYQVEVTQAPGAAPRWRYYVKRSRTTVVRTGLLMVPTTPAREQPSDTCKPWRAVMDVFVAGPGGKPRFLMTNREVEGIDDFGMLQLHVGTYSVEFNGLRKEGIEIREDRVLTLPTASIGPLPHRGYRLSVRQDEASDNPSISLCSRRGTQVLAGTYWGSYWVDTLEPPFRRLVWEQQEIALPGGPNYQRAPKVTVQHKLFKGKGSEPEPVATRPPAAARPAPAPVPGAMTDDELKPRRPVRRSPPKKRAEEPSPGPSEVNPLPVP